VNMNASKWHLQKMGNKAKGMFEYHQTEDCYYATHHHQDVQIFAFCTLVRAWYYGSHLAPECTTKYPRICKQDGLLEN